MTSGFNFELPMILRLRLMDQWNIRQTGRGVAEIEGGVMDVDVLAYKGDQGDPGRDGKPVQIHQVPLAQDVPAIGSLDSSWLGHAWRVAGSRDVKIVVEASPGGQLKYETLTNYLGDKGDTGPAPTFSVRSVASSDTGSGSVTLEQVSPGAWAVDYVLRRGATGAASTVPGPAAAVEAATDYEDGDTAAVAGDVLAKRTDGKWGPRKIFLSPGVYKKAGSDATWLAVDSGNGWVGDFLQITSITIPAQPYPYEPEVDAFVEVMSTANLRIDVEARLGQVSGPLLGRGAGAAISAFANNFTPRHVIRAADETIAVPTSSNTIVPANTQVTIFLVAVRIESGSATRLQTRKERAFLRVRPIPVAV